MSYLKRNFLLSNKTAERLYFDYAEGMPVFDYHCHLPEKEILENKPFDDIAKIWLGGDHYKWRLMRNYGVDEDCITGNRPWAEKFGAYCRVLGTAYGNPLMHWSQTEENPHTVQCVSEGASGHTADADRAVGREAGVYHQRNF